MKNKKKPLYIFFHINKCAGTTLRMGLENQFKNDEFLILYDNEKPFKKTCSSVYNYVESFSQDQKDKIKVILGHQVYYSMANLFRNREIRYITFLREPVTRMISHYNFNRMNVGKNSTEQNFPKNGTHRFSFEAWADFKTERTDFTSRFLINRLNTDENGVNIDKIEIVKEILDNFYFIGIVENRDDFLFAQHELGIRKPLIEYNISKSFYTKDELMPIQDYANKFNVYDQILYEYAKILNEKFKEKNRKYYQAGVAEAIKAYTPINIFVTRSKKSFLTIVFQLSARLKKRSKTYSNLIKYIKEK